MRIELKPGESVEVTFKDSDGSITVEFTPEHIQVEADMPDSDGRTGVIYSERYAESHERWVKQLAEDIPL